MGHQLGPLSVWSVLMDLDVKMETLPLAMSAPLVTTVTRRPPT